jgi:hypothetical protein
MLMRSRRALPIVFAAASTSAASIVQAGLTLDLRATGGSGGVGVVNPKLVDVSEAQPGDTVTFDIVALINGQNTNLNDEGFVNVFGSFLSDNAGPVRGDLKASAHQPYRGSGHSNGLQIDLDGDSDLDVGSNNNGHASNFFNARISAGPPTPIFGSVQTLGTLTMTLTQIPSGAFSSSVNCRPRIANTAGSWFEDGSATGTAQQGPSSIGVGAPVILTDVPEPSAIGLAGIGLVLSRRGSKRRKRCHTPKH